MGSPCLILAHGMALCTAGNSINASVVEEAEGSEAAWVLVCQVGDVPVSGPSRAVLFGQCGRGCFVRVHGSSAVLDHPSESGDYLASVCGSPEQDRVAVPGGRRVGCSESGHAFGFDSVGAALEWGGAVRGSGAWLAWAFVLVLVSRGSRGECVEFFDGEFFARHGVFLGVHYVCVAHK